MASDYDATEFVDGDFQAHKLPSKPASALRAPTAEDTDSRMVEQQQKLAELAKRKEQLERELAVTEETRRRQHELLVSRQEMLDNLTRGLGLLEEAEFNARSDAEQMARAIVALRDALQKVQAIHEESWTADNFNTELTRALTTLENARMEWNGARLKFQVLNPQAQAQDKTTGNTQAPAPFPIRGSFGDLCRLGLALTWPLAIVALAGLGTMVALILILRR